MDQHHTVEDVGIALGEAFDKALGDKKGILRAGYFLMPMDETLGIAAVDLSGRVACVVSTLVDVVMVGDLQTELVEDFFEGVCAGCAGECACEDDVWAVESSQDRGAVQGFCAGAQSGLFEGSAARRDAA